MIESVASTRSRESESPYAKAYFRKLAELLAAGKHPDDAAWEADGFALEEQEAAKAATSFLQLQSFQAATPDSAATKETT
jgi:hypothetical protein